MERLLFQEEQRFTQWWLRFILLLSMSAVLIPVLYGIYSQEVLQKPFGDKPMSTGGLIVSGCFSFLIMAFVFFFFIRSRLKTKIMSNGIEVAFPPIMNKWKKYSPEEIAKFEIRKYKATREFGGHGLKQRRGKGLSCTTSGDVGLQLHLKNGKKILIGTQQKQAIEYAMKKFMQTEKIG